MREGAFPEFERPLAPLSVSASGSVRAGRGHAAQAATKDANLTEEIERLEACKHISLEPEAKRNHRDDHGHADDDAHRREHGA